MSYLSFKRVEGDMNRLPYRMTKSERIQLYIVGAVWAALLVVLIFMAQKEKLDRAALASPTVYSGIGLAD